MIFVLCSAMLTAQTSLQRVNKQFELRSYDLAIPGYLEILHSSPDNAQAMIKVAHAYSKVNEHFEAVKWFSKATSLHAMDDADLLLYGHSLKSLGRYQDAKNVYAMAQGDLSYQASHYFLSCDKARELSASPAPGEVAALKLNSHTSDFSPEPHQGKLYFSSFRKDIKWNDQTAKSLANSAESSNHFVIDIKSLAQSNVPSTPGVTRAFPLHSAPFSIAEQTSIVVFAKNLYIDGNRQVDGKEQGVGLYQAVINTNGEWVDVKALKLNSSNYSNNYPYLTEDGSTLYFASNRPGGYGGYDIYSSVNQNGQWSEAKNLGPKVNTAGDEISPTMESGKLLFSSDWHFGLGGMDIFSASLRDGAWDKITNIGSPVNSPSDDYSYNKVSPSTYVFVSNRAQGYGNEDLYFYSKTGGSLVQASAVAQKTQTESISQVVTKPTHVAEVPTKETSSIARTETVVSQEVVRTEAPTTASKPTRTQNLITLLDKEITLIVQDHTGNRIQNAKIDMSACGSAAVTTNEYGKAIVQTSIDCKVSIKAPGYLRAIVKLADGYVNADGKKTVVLMKDSESDYNYSNTSNYDMNPSSTVSTSSTSGQSSISEIAESIEQPVVITTSTAVQNVSEESYFSVQIAAFGEYSDRLKNYAHLAEYGDVFNHQENGVNKIRVGKFSSREKAIDVMGKLKNRGYADAFIVRQGSASQAINTSTIGRQNYTESRYESSTQLDRSETRTPTYSEATSKYKIRLAAYTDTKWFDIDKVEDLGKIEQWTSSDFTVMVLGNMTDLADAKNKLNTVKARGFNDARIVMDDGGILRYYK